MAAKLVSSSWNLCFRRCINVKARLPLDELLTDKLAFDRNIDLRRIPIATSFEELNALNSRKKQIQSDVISLRQERNTLSKQISGNVEESKSLVLRVRNIKEEIIVLEQELNGITSKLDDLCLHLPNNIHPDVPLSKEEEGIVVSSSINVPFPEFEGFKPKDHLELGRILDLIDFDSPAKTTGSKFVTLKNDGALLELALAQWALQRISKEGFSPRLTPDIAKTSILSGCGFVPRGESSQVFHVKSDSGDHKNTELCLVGTSEVTLAGSMANQHILDTDLPIRLAGFGHCFRVEAGAAGKASKGLYRLHQFSKVEMFSFVHPDKSEEEHEKLRGIQELICEELGLHWRTINMSAHELGASAYKKYDVQVYMPSREEFGEVASVSNCTDFQSRRLDIRYHNTTRESKGFVHTLNGTAIAIPRILLSILETHQQADGSVKIPEVLWPFFLSGKRILEPKN